MDNLHRKLLEMNEEFLVAEAPAEQLVKSLQQKEVLTDLDMEQVRVLDPQGPRAIKRFVVHALPDRGPTAFASLLEALQEARAQHLADLLMEGEATLMADINADHEGNNNNNSNSNGRGPTPAGQPHNPAENVRKLRANKDLIEEIVDPDHVTHLLQQNGLFVPLEERLLAEVKGQRALTWSLLWGVLMQRGPRAYQTFMAALLQNESYSALYHTIEETRIWA